jgi:hypothetical protein
LCGSNIRDLRWKLRVELRPNFDPAISELVNDGLAERVSLDNGDAYRGLPAGALVGPHSASLSADARCVSGPGDDQRIIHFG